LTPRKILMLLRSCSVLLLLVPLLAACAPADDSSSLILTLELELTQSALGVEPDAPLRDALGLYDLQLYSAYVALEVTGDDMDPVTAEWPAESGDLTAFDGSATLELEVPPGDARRLDGLVMSLDGERARLYMPPAPLLMDLAAGAVEDVELVLKESEYGTVAGTAPANTVTVEVVDQVTGVILARAVPDDAGAFEQNDLPVQRPMYPVWDLGDGDRSPAPELATHIPGAGGGATFPAPQ